MFSGFVNFDLLLVTTEAVDTSEPPTLAVNVASVCEIIFWTNAVTVEPALLVNDIESPIFKSVVKFVPLPSNCAELFAIEILPPIVSFNPYVLLNQHQQYK